jgi:hypothetical protein
VRRSQRPIQPRDCCGPTANARESGIRPPSRGTHPLPGQASAGNACGRHHGERMRPPYAWERNRRPRPRTPSHGRHPTVVAANHAEKERLRTPSQAPPAGVSTSGRSARTCGWCRPTSACSLTPFRRPRSFPFSVLSWREDDPDLSCGAADAQAVSRSSDRTITHHTTIDRLLQLHRCAYAGMIKSSSAHRSMSCAVPVDV